MRARRRGEPLGFVISARVCPPPSAVRLSPRRSRHHRRRRRRRRRERRQYKGVGVKIEEEKSQRGQSDSKGKETGGRYSKAPSFRPPLTKRSSFTCNAMKSFFLTGRPWVRRATICGLENVKEIHSGWSTWKGGVRTQGARLDFYTRGIAIEPRTDGGAGAACFLQSA